MDAIRHSKAAKADSPSPRVAGDRAQALRAERLVEGGPFSEGIFAGLAKWAEELGLPMPQNS